MWSPSQTICIALLVAFASNCAAIGHDLIVGNCSSTYNLEPIWTQVIHTKNNGIFWFLSTVEYVLKFPDVSHKWTFG